MHRWRLETEADREPDRASRDGDKAAKGNPRRKPTEHSGTCTRAISLVGWEQKLEGCGWRKRNWSLFLIAREGARRGCGWRDRAEGSVGFAPSGEMPIQGEGCDLHLVLLHLPPHPSPSPRALSGSSYLASPPSTHTPGPGGPGLPAGSPLLASFLELMSTAGGWMGGGLPSGDIQDLGLL